MNPNTLSLIRAVPALGLLLLAFPVWAAFNVNADGTVTDTVTDLVWDRCTWGQTGADCSSGSASTHTWQAALGVAVTANAMNSGAGYKGYKDWRLPSKNELESLVDRSRYNPAIDTDAFPNMPPSSTYPYNYYWTSTTYAPVPANAWSVSFVSGDTYAVNKGNDNHVRLVRSGQSFDDFDLLSPSVTRNADLTAPVLSGQTYTPGAVSEGPAGRFSFTARFCSKSSSVDTLLGLFSRTAVLTNGNSLINRDRNGLGSPPGGVGSELDFPFTGQYSDGLLAPNECVNVLYVIGLQQRKSFSFYVDVFGWRE